ncbi:MAG: pilus assembly protein CpaA [Caulobacteraceae bacterium]|nr:pilus assembly protein CpaA [Caulobacteraceae bacterium]
MTDLLHNLVWAAFAGLVIIAALRDASSFTIPNWISLTLAGLFIPAALLMGMSPLAIGIGLISGLAMLVVGMGMFAMGWIGGGDAKLLAATAMWIGWPSMVTFILVTTLAGGALAVLLVAARSSALQVYAARAPQWVGRLMTPGGNAPYGIAIAIGALVAFPASSIIAAGI